MTRGLGQQIAVRKNQMEALFATPAARKPLTRRHRANTAPLHGFTRGSLGRSNQDQQVQNESRIPKLYCKPNMAMFLFSEFEVQRCS